MNTTESQCLKCGSNIDEMGFCIDETCPRNDYTQHSDCQSHDKRIRVLAEVWTRDNVPNHDQPVEFDCTSYFFDALKKNQLDSVISELESNELQNGGLVAEHFKNGGRGEGQDEVKELFEHVTEQGVVCSVELDLLHKWVKQARMNEALQNAARAGDACITQYFIGVVRERHGDNECDITFIFDTQLPLSESRISEMLDTTWKTAAEWDGNLYVFLDSGYYPITIRSVPETEYPLLQKHLTHFTNLCEGTIPQL